MGLFFRAILGVSKNNFTHIRSFPDGVRVLKNVLAVTFIDTKCTIYIVHVHCDIFILKQNNLLIIKVSFSFIT